MSQISRLCRWQVRAYVGAVPQAFDTTKDATHVPNSVFAIAREALRNHQGWTRAWAAATPKPRYDTVIAMATVQNPIASPPVRP